MPSKLYVGNLPFKITSKDLLNIFSQIGHVTEVMVIPDKKPGFSKGYGFVTFEDDTLAQKAIETYNEYDINGRKIIVKRSLK